MPTPFENMIFSPINLVPKAGSEGKFWLIHNLSYPYTEDCVNACIPQEHCRVQYMRLDDMIDLALQIRKSTVTCHLEIHSAYCNPPLNFRSIVILGLSIIGKIYMNVCLPFGAGSSCAIFERIATIIEWIVKYHGKIPYLKHYLDDYIMLANSLSTLIHQMQKFTDIMVAIGMPLAEEKTLGPCPIIEFLGMVLNFFQQLLQIPKKKKDCCLELLNEMVGLYHAQQKVTVKQVQHLVGHLNFICQALPAGRLFLVSLYQLTAAPTGSVKPVKAGHQRHLNKNTIDDIKMFKKFLSDTAHYSKHSVPFLARRAIFNDSIQLFADSSFVAFSCCFQNAWAQGQWADTSIFQQSVNLNIALLELFCHSHGSILVGPQLQGKYIVLHSDSLATVGWLTRKRAPIPAALQIIRQLTLTCLHFQIMVKAVHLTSTKNRELQRVTHPGRKHPRKHHE